MNHLKPRDARRLAQAAGPRPPIPYGRVEKGKKPYVFDIRTFWDSAILWEVWEKNEYSLDKIDIPEDERIYVIDVGANIGAFTALVLDRWRNARVQAFEPFYRNARMFEENLGYASEDQDRTDVRAFLMEKALYGNKRPFRIDVEKTDVTNTGACRVYFDGPDFNIGYSIHNLMDRDIDILKLDCEGSEEDILLSLSVEELRRIRYIIGEYHAQYFEHPLARLQEHLAQTHHGTWAENYPCGQGIFWLERKP